MTCPECNDPIDYTRGCQCEKCSEWMCGPDCMGVHESYDCMERED